MIMEKGTLCTMMAVENHAMETEDGVRLDSSTKQIGESWRIETTGLKALAVLGFGTSSSG